MDEFIVFEPLREAQIRQIVVMRAQRIIERMKKQRFSLVLADSAVTYLAAKVRRLGLSCQHDCAVPSPGYCS